MDLLAVESMQAEKHQRLHREIGLLLLPTKKK